jgi:hypothetical protein
MYVINGSLTRVFLRLSKWMLKQIRDSIRLASSVESCAVVRRFSCGTSYVRFNFLAELRI